jgi:hypothetical protein
MYIIYFFIVNVTPAIRQSLCQYNKTDMMADS